jgi:NAD(P)-dependent dehydrogenase (short-subunit alcohol dehydrogenase family)
MAREGARVLLVDRDEGHALKTLQSIMAEDGQASVFTGDVSRSADGQAMVETALDRYGALHILVNNVGVNRMGTVVDVREEDWDEVFRVNLRSMMLTGKAAIPAMIASGGGSIIHISSIDGLRAGWVRNIAYAVSKGGVVALTRNMAVQHGRDGIRVNCIAPGFLFAAMTSGLSPELRELRRRATPLGTEGTAWDVAWGAVFLASDEARWITGITLPIDGGILAANPLSLLARDETGLFPSTDPMDFPP